MILLTQDEIKSLESDLKRLIDLTPLPEGGDDVTNRLVQQGLFKAHMSALFGGVKGRYTPPRFLPPELAPMLDGLSTSFRFQEFRDYAQHRVDSAKEIARKAKRDPEWFRDFVERLFIHELNVAYDPQIGAQNLELDLGGDEIGQSMLSQELAYHTMPELWRHVSLALVGKGNYLIGFSGRRTVSKRIREPPNNPAAIDDAVLRWRNLAGHALSFFDIASLDRLVQDGDFWSGADVVAGYPHVQGASELGAQLLNFGYDHRERYNPTLHEFLFGKERVKIPIYRGGQSISSITIADLDDPIKGFEYVIRHVDGTIAAGRLFAVPEAERFRLTASNHVQYMREKPGEDPLETVLGVAVLVAAMGRDMMVYDNRERFYRVEKGMQNPPTHQNLEPVITMLPQRRYEYNLDPNRASSENHRFHELIRQVSLHPVSRHKMRLRPGYNASPKQLALAASLPVPYNVPPGYTFVRDHTVGDVDPNMLKQYTSKSAASVLFGARAT